MDLKEHMRRQDELARDVLAWCEGNDALKDEIIPLRHEQNLHDASDAVLEDCFSWMMERKQYIPQYLEERFFAWVTPEIRASEKTYEDFYQYQISKNTA